MGEPSTEAIETDLLLEGVFRSCGHDFRGYARSSIRRRIRHLMHESGASTISALQSMVLHDPAALERLVLAFSINVTAMFRDPEFFLAFREKVVPILRTYPFVRLWLAGCASGEEVYSMAIVLAEEGLYDKCRIYATDMNGKILAQARRGIYPTRVMREYTKNYIAGGGKASFSEYYTSAHDNAIFSPALTANVVFSEHNLATDGSFNEFHAILCRNVMIYFGEELTGRVHGMLYDSLVRLGYLALGSRESIAFSPRADAYATVDQENRIFRKVR